MAPSSEIGQYEAMTYRALTIDTNVAYGNGFDFEAGLLAQLSQFVGSPTQVILSDIVAREIFKRLVAIAEATREKVERAVQEALQRQLLAQGHAAAAKQMTDALEQARPAARARLDSFQKWVGAEIVPVEFASMAALTRLYFSAAPPFEATGAKKAEFPDAIALLSLEEWARRNGKVLAVSKDGGWKAFAEESHLIDVVEDLAKALEILQEQDKAHKAAEAAGTLLKRIAAGELQDLANALGAQLQRAVENLDLTPDGHSYHQFEAELYGISFQDYSFTDAATGGLGITVVRLEPSEVAFTVAICVTAIVEAGFALQHWDSIDREYVRLGGAKLSKEVEFNAEALITLDGDLEDVDSLEIDDVELIDAISEVDFGEIDMDRGEDYYEP